MEIVIRPQRNLEILTQELDVLSDGQTKQTQNDAMLALLFSVLLGN